MPEIRLECSADRGAVRELVTAAFGDDHAARLVDLLRDSPGYVPELTFVAVEDGRLVGHVMFSHIGLVTVAGPVQPLLCLSPLAVAPHAQRRGVGSALVTHGLAAADDRGEPLVVVEGNPALYRRYGFVTASDDGLERPSDRIPEEGFMSRRLGAYDPRLRGRVVYPEPFWAVDAVGPSSRD
jgi:putative acetyltransferase